MSFFIVYPNCQLDISIIEAVGWSKQMSIREKSDTYYMPLINILSIKICPILFLFTVLSSQSVPGHGRAAPPPAVPQPHGRATLFLPEGLQLLRPDGTFYDLVAPFHLVAAHDYFFVGIMESNRIFRPIFFRQTMVKVRTDGPMNVEIVPLSIREFMVYPFNRNLTPYSVAIRYIAGVRNQHNDSERG